MVIEQIKAQLVRLVPVHKVHDLTDEGPHVEREMALIKVAGNGETRVEALRLADVFRARVIDATTESFVFEMTGAADKLNAFIELMEPLGPGRGVAHRRRRDRPRPRRTSNPADIGRWGHDGERIRSRNQTGHLLRRA